MLTTWAILSSALFLVAPAAAQAQKGQKEHAPRILTDRAPLGDAVVEVEHIDARRAATSPSEPPPAIYIRVRRAGVSLLEQPMEGIEGWRPWGFKREWPRDIDGDGKPEVLIAAFSYHGGSGSVVYLAAVAQREGRFIVIQLPHTTAENIHTGQYFLARGPGGKAGIAITQPLMDGATRADPTRWTVRLFRIQGEKVVQVAKQTTPSRHSELLPRSFVQAALPAGWRIIELLY